MRSRICHVGVVCGERDVVRICGPGIWLRFAPLVDGESAGAISFDSCTSFR
jgi:hypothetical protein